MGLRYTKVHSGTLRDTQLYSMKALRGLEKFSGGWVVVVGIKVIIVSVPVPFGFKDLLTSLIRAELTQVRFDQIEVLGRERKSCGGGADPTDMRICFFTIGYKKSHQRTSTVSGF